MAADTLGADLHLRVELPELAQRLAPGTSELTLQLQGCTQAALEPFDAQSPSIDDSAALAALRLRLIGLIFPAHAAPGVQVLVTAPRPKPDVHGGILRLAAQGHRLVDAAGEWVSPDRLAGAASEWAAEKQRTQTLAGHTKVLAAWVKLDLTPLLQAHGFRRTGQAYIRTDAEVAQMLELETSRFSSAESLSFWINAQLFLGDLRAERALSRDVLRVKAHSVWLRRTGALWGRENDAYTFASGADFSAVTERLVADLAGRVLPFLQHLRTAADVLTYLQEQDRVSGDARSAFALAGALARAGRIDDSRLVFERCRGDDAAANEALRKFALSLGVSL